MRRVVESRNPAGRKSREFSECSEAGRQEERVRVQQCTERGNQSRRGVKLAVTVMEKSRNAGENGTTE